MYNYKKGDYDYDAMMLLRCYEKNENKMTLMTMIMTIIQ